MPLKISDKKIYLFFEEIYREYNKRELVTPDPLLYLYSYSSVEDREIAGLICSSLAFGRVDQILKSISKVLSQFKKLKTDLLNYSKKDLLNIFFDFKYRFVSCDELVSFLWGIKKTIEEYGSLNNCYASCNSGKTCKGFSIIAEFCKKIRDLGEMKTNYLLPVVEKGSACKRINLFLRWMIRNDVVDPNGWKGVLPSSLFVPLDTHLFKICKAFGMTGRSQPDAVTVKEITDFFKKINPEDPVKYDFSLTRFGIRNDLDVDNLINRFNNFK